MQVDSSKKRRFKLLSTAVIIFMFLFYAVGATQLTNFFPAHSTSGLEFNPEFGLTELYTWVGTSYSISAICCVLFVFGLIKLRSLERWQFNFGLAWIAALIIIAAVVLVSVGTQSAVSSIAPLCDIDAESAAYCHETFSEALDEEGRIDTFAYVLNSENFGNYAYLTLFVKYVENFFIQAAVISMMSLTVLLSASNGLFSNGNVKDIRQAYIGSSFLLTLIILADALFFEFLNASARGQASEEVWSAYVAAQRGLLIYLSIISTSALAIVLAICSLIGKVPLMLNAPSTDTETNGSLTSSIQSFVGSPALATVFATFAPIIAAFFPLD